jgi:hypothetical protein
LLKRSIQIGESNIGHSTFQNEYLILWIKHSKFASFQIPSAWDSLWSGGPSVPTQYLEAVIFRAKSTQLLLQSAQSSQMLNGPVNLAQLLRPGTLLNAFRQYSARLSSGIEIKILLDLHIAEGWIFE